MNLSVAVAFPLCVMILWVSSAHAQTPPEADRPFGPEFSRLDFLATGDWWKRQPAGRQAPPPPMNVPRDQVIAFALYTHEKDVLKMTVQLYPLMPDESREARLELRRAGRWVQVAKTPVLYPGWSAHFRIPNWDNSKNVPYRVCHGAKAHFEGLIRRDPAKKKEIVVATLSCNSSRTTGPREEIVANLKLQNPDLLFFAGDQTYRHTEHTAGWIEFGLQFREIIRDRPTVTTPDDHDVGHPNLWGESGKKASTPAGADGGYYYPPEYVRMVERCQTWHLPDPIDPEPIQRGIGVYFTRLRVGGIDFAIIEDRKFKSGPEGKVPQLGPRPDHITDTSYDPADLDRPGLELLGSGQIRFLNQWGQDWTGAQMKAVLSQTAFCGAVHLHGSKTNRLLADLDCNGWPQNGRNQALREIRRAWATHLCGDQHLAAVVKHGIEEWGDGPFAFTNPAIVNTIYGRWWWPADERSGAKPRPPLPWTGDYQDGLGNKITMLAYANPGDVRDEKQRADGYGLARFDKSTRTITFECWPRFASARQGDKAQFPGWPITVKMADNDGRKPVAWLQELVIRGAKNPVVQVISEASGEVLYTVRVQGNRFQPPVYATGTYTVRVGQDTPTRQTLQGLKAGPKEWAGKRSVKL